MDKEATIFVAGARGLVGSALVKQLRDHGYNNLLTPPRSELDMTDPVMVRWYFSVHCIDYVFLAAACVGGIKANAENPLKFFLDNMAIEMNVLENAAKYRVKKLVFLGSSCIYPKMCPQPIKEEYLLTGAIEPTTEPYALAKICGVRLCDWYRRDQGLNFVSAMPCNLFGPRDNFDEHTSHCLPGMLARMHKAKVLKQKEFPVWGNPGTYREFLYSEDLADALITVMLKYDEAGPINTGSSFELHMDELAGYLAKVVGFEGVLLFDATQPVGTPRKLLDNSRIQALGWYPATPFSDAVQKTYDWYCANEALQ